MGGLVGKDAFLCCVTLEGEEVGAEPLSPLLRLSSAFQKFYKHVVCCIFSPPAIFMMLKQRKTELPG